MTGEVEQGDGSVWGQFGALWGVLTSTEKDAYWKSAARNARDLNHRAQTYRNLCVAVKECESGRFTSGATTLRVTGVRNLSADELHRSVARYKARLLESLLAQDFLAKAMCNWIQSSQRDALNAMLDAVACPRDDTGALKRNTQIPEFSQDIAKTEALALAAKHGGRSMMLVCAGLMLSDPGWAGLRLAHDILLQEATLSLVESPKPQQSVAEAHEHDVTPLQTAGRATSTFGVAFDRITDEVTPSAVGTRPIEPQSFQDLYELIDEITRHAKSDSRVGAEPAFRIRELLDGHLDRLERLRPKLTTVQVVELVNSYCSAMLHTISALDISSSEQRELEPALKAAWTVAVLAALREGRPRAWFAENLQERQHLPEFIERFQGQRSKIELASREIEEIRSQLSVAKYTAKTALKASETRKQTEISVAQGELETIRVEAAHYLVPPGRTLDSLMEDESLNQVVDFLADELVVASVAALQSVVGSSDCDLASECNIDELHTQVSERDEDGTPAEPVIEGSSESRSPDVSEHESSASRPASEASVPPSSMTFGKEPEVEQSQQDVVLGTSHPPKSSEDPPAIEPTTRSVTSALHHLQYAESRDDAQQAFRIAYDQFSQVPSGVVEAIAMHWLEAGHLNVAYQVLRDAKDSNLIGERVLDASLLRSAFYGMNLWPKDREALSHTQRDLNLLNHKELEEQLDRKPGGKLVPYLLVCATLQPALFAGAETQAPTLLKLSASYFDGALKQLISNVAEFTMRGGRADLDALRNEEGQELHLAAAKL